MKSKYKGFLGFFASLKLTVIVILGLSVALAIGTILESLYDTPTAQYYVYRSLWFHLLLASLGINIFSVMVDRWPWQRRHAPFLLAHIGILTLLVGSWLTDRYGLDGNLRIAEGETASMVEQDNNSLVITEAGAVHKVRVGWIPPDIEFHPISARAQGVPYDLTIDKFISHADPIYAFISSEFPMGNHPSVTAARIQVVGGAMGVKQDFWLWMGDSSFKNVQMGPARFAIGEELPAVAGRPGLSLLPGRDGGVEFFAVSSDGKVIKGKIQPSAVRGHVIEPGWKGNIKVTILDWIQNAVPMISYQPSRVQFGPMTNMSAIHVVSGKGGQGNKDAEAWLGLGDRAMLRTDNGNFEVGYLPHRVVLPFSIRLDRFTIDRYEGTMDPSSYASRVTVITDPKAGAAGESATISMNEPLTIKGITLYQASYEDAQPRPTVSIFSVNRDPGRFWKYLGSILIVLGSIVLFAVKYRKHKGSVTKTAQEIQRSSTSEPMPSEVL
ncbi:cytochrome c biogenesis protein ResB [Bdellovibrionota bacterium FG-1]